MVWGAFAGAGAAYRAYMVLQPDVPSDLSAALDYHPRRATRVFSADGELIGEFFIEKRVVVPLERIPEHVQLAFIAAEDQRFWTHPGYDYLGIARAAWANYSGGATRQGASTITQQVARMLLLTHERTYVRKMKELILAVRLERQLTKRQLLHIYLNQVYLGRGAYGVQAAAEIYFGKDVEHLTVAEAAMLGGLPKAPGKFAPHLDWARARERQAYVVERMVAIGAITEDEGRAALAEPLGMVPQGRSLNAIAAPYFVEHVRQWAIQRYGHRGVFNGGLRIYTTVDMRKQLAAEVAVRDGLQALDRAIGFRGPVGHLDGDALAALVDGAPRAYVAGADPTAVGASGDMLDDVTYLGAVTEIGTFGKRAGQITIDAGPVELPLEAGDARTALRWRGDDGARLVTGDLIPVRLGVDRKGAEVFVLWQQPDVQAAFVSMDPVTGRVEAMVGGRDFSESQFNRVTQARRQAGSSFKPIIYAAALQRGYTHLTIVRDAPVAVPTASGVWRPGNFKAEYLGNMTLRTALAKSINTVSVRIVLDIGIDAVHDMARALGVTSPLPRNFTLSLGTGDVTLLELTSAYAVFPAGGRKVTPRFVDLVTTGDGVVLEDYRKRGQGEQVISPQLAYLMVDLMKTVVARGTGRKALDLGRPAGGKTGTSTEHRDAWFVGYTADHVAGVWVGRDDFSKPIGADATGGGAALPIWLQYMLAAHPDTPPREFPIPDDILFVRADELTGKPLGPSASSAVRVPFDRGTVPDAFLPAVERTGFDEAGGFETAGALRKPAGPLRKPGP